MARLFLLLLALSAFEPAQGFVAPGFSLARPCMLRDAASRANPRAAASSLRMNEDSGWTAAQDPASGQTYWYNAATQESSWEPPAVQSQPAGEKGMASYGPRMGRLMEVPESQKKNSFRGGKDGLMEAMNPIKPGVIWYKEPSLLGFLAFKIGIVMYTGDFGPFVTFHDGSVDFGQASREWARLHSGYVPPVPVAPEQ